MNLCHILRNSYTVSKPKSYFSTNGMKFDLTGDLILRGIFIDKARVKNFLECILVGDDKLLPKGTELEEIEFLENELFQVISRRITKKIIFDVQIKTKFGRFIVEMQRFSTEHLLNRMQVYSSVGYYNQVIKTLKSNLKSNTEVEVLSAEKKKEFSMNDYGETLPIVVLALVRNKVFDDPEVPCVSYHSNVETDTQGSFLNGIRYAFIELRKFENPNYKQGITDEFGKDWLRLLKDQDLANDYSNSQVQSAVKFAHNLIINHYEEVIRHQIHEEQEELALYEAEEEGREQAARIGAQRMIEEGISIDNVMKLTNLSREEVAELKRRSKTK